MDAKKPVLKFLTKEIAEIAVRNIEPMIRGMQGTLSRQMCHIIILVPAKKGRAHGSV